MDALAASPFALLDARGSLRLVTDAVHEDAALCLALACRPLRDALRARFPACPRAGGRPVAKLAARVTADGSLGLSYDPDDDDSDDSGDDDAYAGLRALPEGIGRLAYLPRASCDSSNFGNPLRKLNLSGNWRLQALPAGLCSLAGLAELNLQNCGLRALPEGVGGLTGLRELNLSGNERLVTALPAGLWSLVGLEELHLSFCRLTALPEGVGGLTGLKKLVLNCNEGLLALPAGLWSLAGLEELGLWGCGLEALPEGVGALAGLKKLVLSHNRALGTLPDGLCAQAGLEELH
jgi:Leucine-rich repeat (LRR) protein